MLTKTKNEKMMRLDCSIWSIDDKMKGEMHQGQNQKRKKARSRKRTKEEKSG